jgi:hypothetical protein
MKKSEYIIVMLNIPQRYYSFCANLSFAVAIISIAALITGLLLLYR